MVELLTGWSVLVLLLSVVFLFFRRNRRETLEKLSNSSSSEDSEKYLPTQLSREEEAVNNLQTSSNDLLSSGPPFEEGNESKENEADDGAGSNHSRASGQTADADESKDQNDDLRRCKEEGSLSRKNHVSLQQRSGGVKSQQETAERPVIPSAEEDPVESDEGKKSFEKETLIFGDVNNTEADSTVSCLPWESDVVNNEFGDDKQTEVTKSPEIVQGQGVDACNISRGDVRREESNNVSDIETVAVSKPLLKRPDNTPVIVEEDFAIRSEDSNFVLNEPNIEEKSCATKGEAVVYDSDHLKNCKSFANEAQSNVKTKAVSPDSFNSTSSERVSLSESIGAENEANEIAHSSMEISSALFETNANDEKPKFVIVEKFSDKLSKSVCDAVLQDTQLLSGYDEVHAEDDSKNAFTKFSSALAESIVKTVLDYSRISQACVDDGDENCRLTSKSDFVGNKIDENESLHEAHGHSIHSGPTDDDVCSSEGTVDDALYKSLNEYARVLSEQVLGCVYELSRKSRQPASCSPATAMKIYATELTESVLTDAIKGVKSCIAEGKASASLRLEGNSLDKFIDEIVENVLQSAISRVVTEDSEERVEEIRNQGGQLSVYINGIGALNHVSGVSGEKIEDNGKHQSKWLSEDDLDELYEDYSSDEEQIKVGNTNNLKDPDDLTDEDHIAKDSHEHLSAPNGVNKKEQTSFWRKSLIQDLDDDLEFEDFESPPSSSPVSPTKSANFETYEFLADGSSGDEVCDTTSDAKVSAPVAPPRTMSSSCRSRLRSVDTSPVLVFDNGSAFLKVGFSGKDMPKEIVPSVVGTPLRYSQEISGMEYSYRPGLVFGGEAVGKAGVLHIDYPLKADVVDKWSDVEGLWNYVLGSLMGIQDSPEFPVLFTQPALNSKKHTEKIAEIMFEHFHVPSLFIANQPVLALYSMGFTSGLSFCSGFSSTQAGVVYEGHILPHTVKQLDIAGYQLTETLRKLLMSGQGFGFRSSSQWQIVNDIKEKIGFVSQDFQSDAKRYRTQAELHTPYELPDGQVIEVGVERFGCAEALFRPMELGLTQPPAHILITEAINSCEEELQEMCYKCMGISGGTTLMSGFVARLEQELRDCDRKFKNFNVPEHRDQCTWLGGSIMASLPTFREMTVSVDEYADGGARVVHSKCF